MAGRPKIYDEGIVLDKAIEVFWKKGYQLASAENLLKAMGIGKGSFYLAFKHGKQELFEKTLHHFFYKYFDHFLKSLKTIENPVESIRGFYYQMTDLTSGPSINGCYFSNALIQIEEEDLKKQAATIMMKISNTFAEVLINAKEKGIVDFNIPNDIVPIYFLNLWTGLNVTRQIEKNPNQIKKLIDEHFKLIT